MFLKEEVQCTLESNDKRQTTDEQKISKSNENPIKEEHHSNKQKEHTKGSEPNSNFLTIIDC